MAAATVSAAAVSAGSTLLWMVGLYIPAGSSHQGSLMREFMHAGPGHHSLVVTPFVVAPAHVSHQRTFLASSGGSSSSRRRVDASRAGGLQNKW